MCGERGNEESARGDVAACCLSASASRLVNSLLLAKFGCVATPLRPVRVCARVEKRVCEGTWWSENCCGATRRKRQADKQANAPPARAGRPPCGFDLDKVSCLTHTTSNTLYPRTRTGNPVGASRVSQSPSKATLTIAIQRIHHLLTAAHRVSSPLHAHATHR